MGPCPSLAILTMGLGPSLQIPRMGLSPIHGASHGWAWTVQEISLDGHRPYRWRFLGWAPAPSMQVVLDGPGQSEGFPWMGSGSIHAVSLGWAWSIRGIPSDRPCPIHCDSHGWALARPREFLRWACAHHGRPPWMGLASPRISLDGPTPITADFLGRAYGPSLGTPRTGPWPITGES